MLYIFWIFIFSKDQIKHIFIWFSAKKNTLGLGWMKIFYFPHTFLWTRVRGTSLPGKIGLQSNNS
jgi:hypothetical protein